MPNATLNMREIASSAGETIFRQDFPFSVEEILFDVPEFLPLLASITEAYPDITFTNPEIILAGNARELPTSYRVAYETSISREDSAEGHAKIEIGCLWPVNSRHPSGWSIQFGDVIIPHGIIDDAWQHELATAILLKAVKRNVIPNQSALKGTFLKITQVGIDP